MQPDQIITELKNLFKLNDLNFSFTCAMYLAGDSKKQIRKEIMFKLTGEDKPLSKCGLHAVETALTTSFIQYQLF